MWLGGDVRHWFGGRGGPVRPALRFLQAKGLKKAKEVGWGGLGVWLGGGGCGITCMQPQPPLLSYALCAPSHNTDNFITRNSPSLLYQ